MLSPIVKPETIFIEVPNSQLNGKAKKSKSSFFGLITTSGNNPSHKTPT
jgi:hypothetical protein